MKILALGGNGAVGHLAIDELMKAGHNVTALVRNPSSMRLTDPRLTVVQGEPTKATDLLPRLAGQDAVLSTLGARTNKNYAPRRCRQNPRGRYEMARCS